jgi:hypothetical protein
MVSGSMPQHGESDHVAFSACEFPAFFYRMDPKEVSADSSGRAV